MSYFWSIFGPNYTFLLKHTSKCNNFSKTILMLLHCNFFYLKIVLVESKNESVKSLNRGTAKYFNVILSCKGGVVRIQKKKKKKMEN